LRGVAGHRSITVAAPQGAPLPKRLGFLQTEWFYVAQGGADQVAVEHPAIVAREFTHIFLIKRCASGGF
jgi:hypothetical protein